MPSVTRTILRIHIARLGYARVSVGALGMYVTAPAFLIVHVLVVRILAQGVVMPLLGLARPQLADYMPIDRYRVRGLGLVDIVNCLFCGWVNGIAGYMNAVTDRAARYNGDPHLLVRMVLYALGAIYTLAALPLQTTMHLNNNYVIAASQGYARVGWLQIFRDIYGNSEYGRGLTWGPRLFLVYQKTTWSALNRSLEQIESAWCPIRHLAAGENIIYPEHHRYFLPPDRLGDVHARLDARWDRSSKQMNLDKNGRNPMHLLAFSLRHPLTLLFIHGLALIAALAIIGLRLAPALDTNPYGESPRVLISHQLFDNTISNIIGSDNDQVQRLNAFRDTFGADEFVQVTVSGKGRLDSDVLSRIAALVGDLELGYEGSQVVWIGRSPHAPDNLKLNMPTSDGEVLAFLARLQLDPTARRMLRMDGSTWDLSLLVQMPMGEHDDADRARFIDHIQTTWQGADLPSNWHVAMIGVPTLLSGLRSALEKTITVNFPLVNVIVIGISWLVARRVRLVLLVYLPLLQAEIWLAALYLGSAHSFNYVTGNMSTVVMVIGTAINIHVLSAYVTERGKHGPGQALVRAFDHVGRPIAFATFTTTLALLSFFASHDPAIRDFGLFASAGLLGVLLCTFTLLPALVGRLDEGGDHATPKPLWVIPWLLGLSRWAWQRPRKVLTLTAGLMLAGLVGIAFLKIGTNVHGYFMPGSELRQALRYTGERFPGYIPFEVVVTLPRAPALDAVAVIDLSRSIERAVIARTRAEGDPIEASDILSLADLVDAFCLDPEKVCALSRGTDRA